MDENDLSNYVYIEDLDYDVDIFSYPCPPGFPLPHIAYCRKVRKISVVDCEAMTDLEFPLVLPHQEGFEQKLGKKKLHHPVLLLGELVPNKDKILDLDLSAQTILASSLPAIRIIVTDHFLERTEKEASTGGAALTLWVKDHEDVWYRLANSYHPKYRSMGERIVEMIRQCDLAKGIIPSYKICECAIAENAIMNGVKAADVMDAWSSVNSNKKTPSSGVSYIIEGLMLVDVSKGIFMKSYVSLNCLELLWPKVENGRAASLRLPCLLANKLFTLQGPDASYKPQVLKVAELLYGSGSVYKKPKRMPDSEEFFTVMDFVLCYDSLEEQQCAVQDISGSSTVVLRGRLKSISNRASNKTTLTFNIVAYLQDYYVDIDCSRTGAIGNNPRRIMLPHYFVRPMVCAGGCWFRLQRPSDYYYLYREPEDLITQVYTWPSEAKDEVWRRICNYEVSEGNCEKHIRVTAVSDSNYNKVVLKGELLSLPAETKTKQITFPEQQRALKVRLYPYKASIDFGDYVAVDNAGLWMSDLTGVWYKLCQPAAHAYSSMASIDICLVDATLALSSCLIYLNNRASKHVSVCTCGNDRRLTIDCSLSKLWELSEQAFDLKIINAESTLFQQYMSSRICFTESKLFCKSCGIGM
ncbi:hypothetical protein EON65_14515 [archaeon]|nr:MAG: hypothetical protein EON65_14515 [archaeon]